MSRSEQVREAERRAGEAFSDRAGRDARTVGVTVVLDGESVSVGELGARIAAKRSREERAWLAQRRDELLAAGAGLHLDRLAAMRDAARAVVPGDYVRAWSEISGFDHDALAADGARFLAGTRDLLREAAAWERRRCPEIPQKGDLAEHDVLRLLRAEPLDGPLSPERLHAALERMGIESGGDAAELRGLELWRGRLEDVAHERFAAEDEGRDRSVACGWAATLGLLPADGVWLRRSARLEGPELESVRRSAAFAALVDMRFAIARLGHELRVHRDQVDLRATWIEDASDALGARCPGGDYASVVEPGLVVAHRIRGAALEAALSEHLRSRFDEDWFHNPRTAPHVADLFADRERSGEALARILGGAIDLDRLAPRFEKLLE